MTKPLTLTSRDRDFFRTVSLAAVANPFSPQRETLDRNIAASDGSPPEHADLIDLVTERVAGRLEALRKAGRNDPLQYTGEDRSLLQTAFQFEIYHRFRAPFDRFILDQQSAGDRPIKLSFAREVLSELERLGYSSPDSLRYLEIFYQIRRAFYFIETALVGLSPSMHALRLQLWNNIFTCDINWYDSISGTGWRISPPCCWARPAPARGRQRPPSAVPASSPSTNKTAVSGKASPATSSPQPVPVPGVAAGIGTVRPRKGAFTGAIENHEGVFSRCTPHGSIFLDEIGDVSVPVQIKLLQVLQERTFSPVGSHDRLRFNGRVIAATNRPLDELRQTGQFRDDFYYRLCSDMIIVPPLRQRIQEEPRELQALVASILNRMLGEVAAEFSSRICETLLADLGTGYPWPGNVRELEQAVRRILLTNHYTGDAQRTTGRSA